MKRGPYRQDYLQRRKRTKQMTLIFALVIAVLLPFLMTKPTDRTPGTTIDLYGARMGNDPARDMGAGNKQQEPSAEQTNPQGEETEIATPTPPLPLPQAKPEPAAPSATVAQSENQPDFQPVPKKVAERRRYYFNVLQDGTNEADIVVIDGYSGEVRVLNNVKTQQTLRPFTSDNNQALYYRYYVQSFHRDGAVAGIVMDMYTSEIKPFENIVQGVPVTLFDANRTTGTLRYTARCRFNSSEIDIYTTDTITGEVRWVSRPALPGSLQLFDEGTKGTGVRRYFTWVTYYYGRKYLHCLDSFTGAVNRFATGEREGTHRFGDSSSMVGDMRFDGLVLYRYKDVQVVSMDQFTGEVRFNVTRSPQWPVTAGQPVSRAKGHPFGFRRYTLQTSVRRQGLKAVAFDTFTGKFHIAFFSYDQPVQSYRFFSQSQEKGVDRYQMWVLFNDDDTLDLFAIDTYTSQIKILRSIPGDTQGAIFQ